MVPKLFVVQFSFVFAFSSRRRVPTIYVFIKNKKTKYMHRFVNPSFFYIYIKVGLKGVVIPRTCLRDERRLLNTAGKTIVFNPLNPTVILRAP